MGNLATSFQLISLFCAVRRIVCPLFVLSMSLSPSLLGGLVQTSAVPGQPVNCTQLQLQPRNQRLHFNNISTAILSLHSFGKSLFSGLDDILLRILAAVWLSSRSLAEYNTTLFYSKENHNRDLTRKRNKDQAFFDYCYC